MSEDAHPNLRMAASDVVAYRGEVSTHCPGVRGREQDLRPERASAAQPEGKLDRRNAESPQSGGQDSGDETYLGVVMGGRSGMIRDCGRAGGFA